MLGVMRKAAPVLLVFFLAACNLTAPDEVIQGDNPTPEPLQPTEAVQTPLPLPSETPAPPEPTATATLVHLITPGAGTKVESSISDTISGDTAHQGSSNQPPGGDEFLYNLYERPFNALTQDVYFPDLDIRSATLGLESPWMYATIYLYDLRPETNVLAGIYGIEIDLNVDGRGEWLILADSPLADDWSVTGVRAWKDTNHNVGQTYACYTDPPQTADSYDLLVFDQGIGDDPDAAWARFVPGTPPAVQVAFKHSLIGSDVAFMWNAWADQGLDQAQWFDYHDHFTYAEAGSPFTFMTEYYPMKAIAELDNTCRYVYGFSPVGNEPCLCAGNVRTPTPSAPASLGGYVWKDLNQNGVYDGAPPDGGLGVATVVVHTGACPGTGVAATASSGAWGRYDVGNLPPGTYCVEVPAFGSLYFTPENLQVTLASGEFRDNLNFMVNFITVGP